MQSFCVKLNEFIRIIEHWASIYEADSQNETEIVTIGRGTNWLKLISVLFGMQETPFLQKQMLMKIIVYESSLASTFPLNIFLSCSSFNFSGIANSMRYVFHLFTRKRKRNSKQAHRQTDMNEKKKTVAKKKKKKI